MAERVDVVVIGMGPGGEAVAGQLAEAGLSVVGIDAHLVGGECPYYGCVPSKMMIRAANALAEGRRIPGLAGDIQVAPDYAPVAARIRAEATDHWDDKVAVDRFVGKGGRFVRGTGRITGPGTVPVGDDEFTATRAIVLNTGTAPAVPPIPGLADTPLWTNREAVAAETVPASLIVLGAGAVGLELAQVFARFGSAVSVVELAERVLPLEESEASQAVADALTAEGLTLHTGVAPERVSHDGTAFTVTLPGRELHAERLLVATGRRTDLAGLGLATIGVDTTGPFVDPDEHMRIAEGVYAIGDVTGKGAFTHVSMYQAAIATRHILGQDGPAAEFPDLPAAVELARVLRPAGRLGITGVVADPARLPAELAGVAVLAEARPLAEHAALLTTAGLRVRRVERHDTVVVRMIDQIEARLGLLRLTSPSRAETLGGLDVAAARTAVADRALGYGLLVADKP